MARNSGTPSPAVIDIETTKITTWKQQKGPLSDWPKGVTKTEKFYKSCDNVCYTCDYDISKNHNSGNCKCKKNDHVNAHTGDNSAFGASIKDKEFSKWP